MAFLAIYSLLLYAEAADVTEAELVSVVAGFDPQVHPVLGELGARLCGDNQNEAFEPTFLLTASIY